MAKKVIFYFKLAWLCLKLSFELFVFALNYLLLKTDQKKVFKVCCSLLILLTIITNVYLFNKKNTPQIELNQIQSINYFQTITLSSKKVILEVEQLQEQLDHYQKIEQKNVKSLELLLNLSQINKALGDNKSTQEYLNKAKEILPINSLEN